ncbi:hypothetical protein MKW98_008717, partial [Papaver atlanticum]
DELGSVSATGISLDDCHFPVHTMDKLKKAVASQLVYHWMIAIFLCILWTSLRKLWHLKVQLSHFSQCDAFSATSLQDQLSLLEGLLVVKYVKFLKKMDQVEPTQHDNTSPLLRKIMLMHLGDLVNHFLFI